MAREVFFCVYNSPACAGNRDDRREDLGLTRAEFAVLRAPRHAAEDPGLPLRPGAELRARRRHLPPGARGAAHPHARTASRARCSPPARCGCTASRRCCSTCARCATSTTWWRCSGATAAGARSPRPTASACAARDPVYRTPARARHVVLPRVHQPARATRRCANTRCPFDLRRIDPQLWVSGAKNAWEVRRGARRAAPLHAGAHAATCKRRHAPRSVRARASAACCSTAGRARCWQKLARRRKSEEVALTSSRSTLPIFSSATLRRAASLSQYFWNSGASR